MHKKQFVVLGMGKFGSSVATTLADCGCEVLVMMMMRKESTK